MSAADVLGVLAALDGRGIPAWLDGGWGIDALLGEQTRPHEDVDLVVPVPDVPALVELLGAQGYRVTEGRRRDLGLSGDRPGGRGANRGRARALPDPGAAAHHP